MRQPILLCLCAALLSAGTRASFAAHFTDTFATDPGRLGRTPFMWNISAPAPGTAASWEVVDGALQYRTQNGRLEEASAIMPEIGLDLTDDSTWSVETSFCHVSGTPPGPQVEAVFYVGWAGAAQGQYRLLSPVYDAGKQQLILLNGGGKVEPIPVDLSGGFHTVRITVKALQARLYVDGQLRGGPYPVGSLQHYGNNWFLLGPITRTVDHTLCCRWKYFAFTDEGAIVPGARPAWEPAKDAQPVRSIPLGGPTPVDLAGVFDHPPYPGIRLVSRDRGADRFNRALPEHVRRWYEIGAARPQRIETLLYQYPGSTGPSVQNVYRQSFPLQADGRRCLAILFMTRGIDDTIDGYIDYKMWYCVSTDGGRTYDEERPLVQRGKEYSPTHPNRYVWVGKNGFVMATLQPFVLPMSNGQMFLPCYYAPLDAKGNYYNPLKTSTYSLVCGLIGTWNEAGDDVVWDVTDPIRLTPKQSTGGLSECAVIELSGKPGRILMAMRAGNEGDRTGKVPCWKWKTLSTDYGKTWSKPTPLTFSDGSAFLSPTAQSNFVRSSRTGKVYWIGNLSRVTPRGGWPRYPLVIAELDEKKLGLRKGSVTILDDRGPDDSSNMQLSNFSFMEDAETGHILVTLDRMRGGPAAQGRHTYVIEVE